MRDGAAERLDNYSRSYADGADSEVPANSDPSYLAGFADGCADSIGQAGRP